MLKDTLVKLLKLDGLIDNVTGYVEARIELMKLEIKEDLSKTLAKLAMVMVLVFAFSLFMLLISMAVAFKIGERIGTFGGFAIVAGFYFALILILVLFRDSISAALEKHLEKIMNRKEKKK